MDKYNSNVKAIYWQKKPQISEVMIQNVVKK